MKGNDMSIFQKAYDRARSFGHDTAKAVDIALEVERQAQKHAALLEAKAAQREFSEAYKAYDGIMGSESDYAMVSAAGYADAAERAYEEI